MIEQIAAKFAVLVFVVGAGASFAFGFAVVCRLLKWAPINVIVNVNNPPQHDVDA